MQKWQPLQWDSHWLCSLVDHERSSAFNGSRARHTRRRRGREDAVKESINGIKADYRSSVGVTRSIGHASRLYSRLQRACIGKTTVERLLMMTFMFKRSLKYTCFQRIELLINTMVYVYIRTCRVRFCPSHIRPRTWRVSWTWVGSLNARASALSLSTGLAENWGLERTCIFIPVPTVSSGSFSLSFASCSYYAKQSISWYSSFYPE